MLSNGSKTSCTSLIEMKLPCRRFRHLSLKDRNSLDNGVFNVFNVLTDQEPSSACTAETFEQRCDILAKTSEEAEEKQENEEAKRKMSRDECDQSPQEWTVEMTKLVEGLLAAFSSAEASFAKASTAHVPRTIRRVCDLLDIDLVKMTQEKVNIMLAMLDKASATAKLVPATKALMQSAQMSILLSILQLCVRIHLAQPWKVSNFDFDARALLYYGFADPFNNPHVSELPKSHADFSLLKKRFCCGVRFDQTTKESITIFKVDRPAETQCFADVPRAETGLFYHGTQNDRLASIIEDGLLLKTKYNGRATYGPGLYFSSSSRISFAYTSMKPNLAMEDHGCMLVVELHLGHTDKQNRWQPNQFLGLDRPTLKRDSSTMLSDGSVMPSAKDECIIVMREQSRIRLRYLISFNSA